jgi:hypothetical protein
MLVVPGVKLGSNAAAEAWSKEYYELNVTGQLATHHRENRHDQRIPSPFPSVLGLDFDVSPRNCVVIQ